MQICHSAPARKKLSSLLLALCILLSLIPAYAFASDSLPEPTATVYLSGTAGNNDNDGLTEDTAVKTMTVAYDKLYALMQAAGRAEDPSACARVVITGSVSFSTTNGPSPKTFENHIFTILVTAKSPELGITIKLDYNHLGPTVYENLTLIKDAASKDLTYFCANGYPLTIGENVTTVAKANGYNFCLTGGTKDTAYEGGSHLTVRSGAWRNVYVGNYKGTMTGAAVYEMSGGTIDNYIGVTYNGTHTGPLTMTFTGGTVNGTVYGGNTYTSGAINGDVSISVSAPAAVNGDLAAGGRTGANGSVQLALSNCAVRGSVSTECSGEAAVDLEAAAGQTLSIGGGSLPVRSFQGGGTLSLSADTTLKVQSVTGSTLLSFQDTPYNMVYITAPDTVPDDAFTGDGLAVSVSGGEKKWSVTNGKTPAGLTVTAPEGVSVTVSTEFTKGHTIVPTSVTSENGVTSYFFTGLSAGNYRYTASGEGYYTLTKNFIYTAAEETSGKTITADPGRMAGTGYEPRTTVSQYTDEVLEKLLPSSTTQWPGYESVFDTPAFTVGGKARNEVTTQQEMLDFLASLDGADDNMYLYSIGTSPVNGFDIPIAVFSKTDLSGAETLEQAAALIRADGKPTIHYQAQIHSNEPAGGEGALSIIRALDGSYGDSVLDSVDIYVIPRINVDGAVPYQRANVAQSIDMNRDHLFVQSKEVTLVHAVYNLFMPEVAIDGHEFNATTTSASATLDDVQVGAAGSLNSSAAVNETAQDMVHGAFDAASALDLRPYNYGSYASTVNNAIGRAYYGLYGSLSFLIETRGIGAGRMTLERRVIAQYVVVQSLIGYVVDHADEVVQQVAQGREAVAAAGASYDESDSLVLTHGVSQQNGYTIVRPKWDLGTGECVDANATGTIYRYDIAERVRPRPMAYVLPRGEEWAEIAASIMETNGVSFYTLDPGAAVLLQQYTGSASDAALTAESSVTFENGAYVFPMNQVGGNIIAMTMEPDVTDSSGYNGTLVQSGVVTAGSDGFPIYRYIRGLNADGKIDEVSVPEAPEGLSVEQPAQEAGLGAIVGLDGAKLYEFRAEDEADYTAVPAGSTRIDGLEIGVYFIRYPATGTSYASKDCRLEVVNPYITSFTVYVGGEGASDENNGRTRETSLATLTAAYAKLAVIMRHAPEGAEGTIVFLSTVTFASETDLPAHDFPVVLTSATGAEGIASQYNFSFFSETRLENMSVTLLESKLHYISANGCKVVFGEGLTCVPAGSHYFNLVAGARSKTITGDTDLTVQSGTWRNVYAASYSGGLNGDAHLTMTGGTVTATVQASYSGLTTGSVTMDLSGVSIGSNVYGANTKSNDVQGDVTITLGSGVSVDSVYGGSRDAGSVGGTATLILDGADFSGSLIGGCENSKGTVGASAIVLKSGSLTGALDAQRVVLDTSSGGTLRLAGDLTIDEVIGGGTAEWPAASVLTVSGAVSGTTKVRLTGTLTDGDHYIVTPESADKSAFSYLGEMVFAVKTVDGLYHWFLQDAPSPAPDPTPTPTPSPAPAPAPSRKDIVINISAGDIAEAEKKDAPVVAPIEIDAAASSADAEIITINVPASAGMVSVEIPVRNVTSGTVAVVVRADGTEEIVKTSVVTDTGLVLGVTGSMRIKIIDNSKFFSDTADHWSRDEVNFVAARELFNGVGSGRFDVSGEMTRSMVCTVLARLSGADTTGGDPWYARGVAWAVENGVSDGTAPEASVTREQLAAMLYRYAGSPAVSGELTFADAGSVSAYAQDAMLWASQNGIINGVGGGLAAPQATAERAQVAAMFARYIRLMAK